MWKGLATVGLLVVLAGCKPVDKPVNVEFGTSDTAFLVQVEGDGDQADLKSEQYLKDNLVQARRQQITYRWVPTGRWYNWWSGYYIPNEKTIVVDRSPETREWTAGTGGTNPDKDEAIWVESRDSVGFSTGISVTGRIDDTEDAIKFLFNYPAVPDQSRMVDCSTIDGKENYQVHTTKIADIMDTEVRTKIQEAFADEAAKYDMDDLRAKKTEILAVLRGKQKPMIPAPLDAEGNKIGEDVVDEDYVSVVDFFAERGFTITTIGMFGGYKYENTEIQASVDKVFQEQLDRQVAIAEKEAAEERKDALRLKGEGAALEVEEAAKGEAAAIQAVADAKAYELEKLNENPEAYITLKMIELENERLKVWDGRYPSYYIGTPLDGLGGGNLSMFLPQPDSIQIGKSQPKPAVAATPPVAAAP